MIPSSQPFTTYLVTNLSEHHQTEQLHHKLTMNAEDSLTAVAWHPGGEKFVAGGARGQFYLISLDVRLLLILMTIMRTASLCLKCGWQVLFVILYFVVVSENLLQPCSINIV